VRRLLLPGGSRGSRDDYNPWRLSHPLVEYFHLGQ
jgi:hypothetical protein